MLYNFEKHLQKLTTNIKTMKTLIRTTTGIKIPHMEVSCKALSALLMKTPSEFRMDTALNSILTLFPPYFHKNLTKKTRKPLKTRKLIVMRKRRAKRVAAWAQSPLITQLVVR